MIQENAHVKLVTNYRDPSTGVSFKLGQTGKVVGIYGNSAAVDFDGYQELRERNARRVAEYGEGANIVQWAGTIPVEFLRLA